jgi:hypothetical protein
MRHAAVGPALHRQARRLQRVLELAAVAAQRVQRRVDDGHRRQALQLRVDQGQPRVLQVGLGAHHVVEEPFHHRAVQRLGDGVLQVRLGVARGLRHRVDRQHVQRRRQAPPS